MIPKVIVRPSPSPDMFYMHEQRIRGKRLSKPVMMYTDVLNYIAKVVDQSYVKIKHPKDGVLMSELIMSLKVVDQSTDIDLCPYVACIISMGKIEAKYTTDGDLKLALIPRENLEEAIQLDELDAIITEAVSLARQA